MNVSFCSISIQVTCFLFKFFNFHLTLIKALNFLLKMIEDKVLIKLSNKAPSKFEKG